MTDRTVEYAGVGTAQLSADDRADGDPYIIHGVALGIGDVTKGKSRQRKVWPEDELRAAAATLTGKDLVRDHVNSTAGKIGEVVHAEFVPEIGVMYEAAIAPHYEQLANDIRAGLMDVSVRAYHAPEDELEERDDGALVVEDVVFDNLSVVNDGASPSNTARVGPIENHPSMAEASAVSATVLNDDTAVATLERSVDASEDLAFDAGDAPSADYSYGGPLEDPPEDDDEDTVEPSIDIAALADIPGTYEADGTVYAVAPDEHPDEHTEHADDAKYPLTSCTGDDSVEVAWRLRKHGDYDIDEGTLARRIKDAADAMNCDLDLGSEEASGDDVRSGPPEWDEGDWVEWQVQPDAMFGQVVHNPEEEPYVMIDVWEDTDDGYQSTQHTDTAGVGDVRPLNDARKREIQSQYNSSELADTASEGDWVRWDTRNSTEIGRVEGVYGADDTLPEFRGSRGYSPEGDETLLALQMYKERDGTYHPISGKPIGHYVESVRHADAPDGISDEEVELSPSATGEYSLREGQWVQWYPDDTEMSGHHGKATSTREADANAEPEKIITIQPYDQGDDGVWSPTGDEIELPEADVAPWGNYPDSEWIESASADALADDDARQKDAPESDQKEGSDTNEPGSADSTPEDIDFSDQVETSLQNKVDEHNEEYGDEDGKKVTLRKLKAVYRRGAGAYSSSHREGMTRNQWAMARVNAFLYLVRNGDPENDAYTQDNDLLPNGHKRATENAAASAASPSHSGTATAPTVWLSPVEQLATPSASMDELDEVYADWEDAVNMTAAELTEWRDHPCATEASVDPEAVIERNLGLLETDKSEWDTDHIADAKRTISFIARMSDSAMEPDDPRDGVHGCPSKWAISLLNWAYNPFDSIPDVPEQMDDEMQSDTGAGEELMELSPDHDDMFMDESDAESRAMELGLDGETHEHEMDGETYYMPGASMSDYQDAVEESSGHKMMDDDEDMDDEEEDDEMSGHGGMYGDDEDEDEDEDDEDMDGDEMSASVLPVASLSETPVAGGDSTAPSTSTPTTAMIDYEPTSAENLDADVDEPIVVEKEDFEELTATAETAAEVDAELSELSSKLDERDHATEIVAELSEEDVDLIESDTEAAVVEASAAEMFDEVQRIYAEELAEFAPFSAEELADRFSPTELKERVEGHDEAQLSSALEDTEVEPDADSASAEELADAEADEDASVRERYAAELESAGWSEQAQKVRDGEIDIARAE